MQISTSVIELIDAYFIKKLRRSRKDTAEELCSKIGINKTSLYYVENGVKRLSEDMLNKILSYYQVDYNRDNRLYEEAYNFTIRLYDSFVFKDKKKLMLYENEFKKKECIFENSRGFIFNGLIQSIIDALKESHVYQNTLEDINEYLQVYDKSMSSIYAIMYGFKNDIFKNLNDAKEVVFSIYENNYSDNLKPSIKGMLYYQLGKINACDGEPLIAIKWYEKAILYLQEIYCIERVNQTKIEIAGALLDLSLYKDAEKLYLNALEEARQYSYCRRICACLNNLAYLHFIQRNYEKCDFYVNKAKESGSTHPDINYYLAYCAYKTKSRAEARSLVSKLLKGEEDQYTYRMLKMIQGFINDNYKLVDLFFERSKKYLLKVNDRLDLKILYEMNIMYYKDKNYDRLIQLIDEYINLNVNSNSELSGNQS